MTELETASEYTKRVINEIPRGSLMFKEQHFNGLYALDESQNVWASMFKSRSYDKFLQVNQIINNIKEEENVEPSDKDLRWIWETAIYRYVINPAFCVGFNYGWDKSMQCDKGACYNTNEDDNGGFKCSKCESEFNIESLSYCPNCGRRIFDSENKTANINRTKH